ncbi:hypothetical protein [Blastococcus tunisiensis]|uniref:Uncharacterized protein n=1 Tax=Blastococcus tunisiensis TaxID=1798228 RepID=A0A1I2DQT5_9ACTN|nr:hypothetical protein [Blastococcus sp. DSM 46838]SFE82631.1 hypothetical protein SAMN05216574_10679 [Blastococcus sp. DSM 46838]
MGLRRRLTAAAVRRATVLVVEVPGWGRTRCAVEREIRDRGWRPAASPADADVLLVCGRPGARLAAAVDLAWEQLPGPRARAEVLTPSGASAALDRALDGLADDDGQRADAAARPGDPAMGIGADEDPDGDDAGSGHETSDEDSDDGDSDDGDSDDGDSDDGDSDDGDSDDGDSGDGDSGDGDSGDSGDGSDDDGAEDDESGEDESGEDDADDSDDSDEMDMDMPMPAGIPLAGGGEARDGLEMDLLHVPLGPVLPAWPPGLVLHCTVQGDVVQEARAEVLPPGPDAEPDGDLVQGSPADRCDRAARILTVAGWADAAAAAARLRDELLDADGPGSSRPALDRLDRRVRRSWTLRRSLRGVPAAAGNPPAGDVHDQLLRHLDQARHPREGGVPTPVATVPLDRLPDLVAGQELAAVRLLVAAADLSPATLVRSGAGLS